MGQAESFSERIVFFSIKMHLLLTYNMAKALTTTQACCAGSYES